MSDGFEDQFGVSKGKKFMSKLLISIINESRNNEIREKGKFIEQKFVEWNGSIEQIDDVLLAGFEYTCQ